MYDAHAPLCTSSTSTLKWHIHCSPRSGARGAAATARARPAVYSRVLTEYSPLTALSSRARGGRRHSRVLRRDQTQRRAICRHYSHRGAATSRLRMLRIRREHNAPTHTPAERTTHTHGAGPAGLERSHSTDRPDRSSRSPLQPCALQQPVGTLRPTTTLAPPSRAADGSGSARARRFTALACGGYNPASL